jgi:hypothetical protein
MAPLGFGWAFTSYLLLQKFEDSHLERVFWVSKFPWLCPLAAFGGFVSSTLATVFLADWRYGLIPIVLWLLLGFVCAEVAIRRRVRRFKETGHEVDRGLAIFCINESQGRGYSAAASSALNRYPFISSGLTYFAYVVLGWHYHWYYRIRNRL